MTWDWALSTRWAVSESSRAFEKLAIEQGVKIHYNAPVTRILAEPFESAEAVVVNGEIIPADAVIANADYHHVETQLLEPYARSYSEKYWQKRVLSPSALLVFLGVEKRLPGLQHHNLLFDADWDGHFGEVFTTKSWSHEPLLYVCVPSRTDASVAPKDHENLFLLAPMAAGLTPRQHDMEVIVDKLIKRIEKAAGTKFAKSIVVKDIRAHKYFEETFNAFQGNAFGLSHTRRQSAVLRPRLMSRKVPNLYYVGQYTNPGTGVPMVVISGKIVSRLVTERLK